jgi:hypothetical protein
MEQNDYFRDASEPFRVKREKKAFCGILWQNKSK